MRALAIVRRILLAAVVVTALGCGGDDGGGEDADDGIDIQRGDDTSDDAQTDEASEDASGSSSELPGDSFELAAVCEDGAAFGGLPAYEAGPGIHPIFLFNELEDDAGFIYGSYELPAEWGPDPVTADAGDLEDVELVGCLRQVDTSPTGQDCDFDDDGDSITLELVDATWEVEVIAGQSGESVDTVTIEASDDGECPFLVSYDEGDTEHVASLDDDDVVAALQPIVEA